MEKILNDLLKTYNEKNKKYGNSFHDLYKDFGPISAITQIMHKANRLKYLAKGTNNKEEIIDTLVDLANYAIMTLMEIDNTNEK